MDARHHCHRRPRRGDRSGASDCAFANCADPRTGAINAIRIGGYPALLVSDGASVRAARLLGSSSIAAARGLSNATVAAVEAPKLASDRVTFDQLGLAPASAEVYGRAEIGIAINTRSLPAAP